MARSMIAMMDGRERGEGWCDFKKKEEALWEIKKKEEDLWWTWHRLKEEGKGFHDARTAKKRMKHEAERKRLRIKMLMSKADENGWKQGRAWKRRMEEEMKRMWKVTQTIEGRSEEEIKR